MGRVSAVSAAESQGIESTLSIKLCLKETRKHNQHLLRSSRRSGRPGLLCA